MRLFARIALTVTLLTAALPLIASLMGCAGMACCAHSEDRYSAPMTCCPEPSVSSSPDASQAKTRITEASKAAWSIDVPLVGIVAETRAFDRTVADTPSSPPTRVRLAHLSTLLI